MEITLFHGSDRKIEPECIVFPGPREHCDFGPGFYLTDDRQVAEEWVCRDDAAAVNTYRVLLPPSLVLSLKGTDWLRVVLGFRLRKYGVVFKSPVVHGLIANDRLFDSLRDFTRGIIGDIRLMQCLDYCKLGSQYCLRERIDRLFLVDCCALTAGQKRDAQRRVLARRANMAGGLLGIYRTPAEGEKFVEEYLAWGDYREV